MKISGYQNRNLVFSGTQMLQSKGQRQAENRGIGSAPEDRDTVNIALFGQNGSSRIKHLMGQRQALLERKNAWTQSALENGEHVKSMRELLDSYEEQLKELDRQITQEMARQNREQLEKTQSSKKEKEPKTGQEIERERISSLVALSSGMSGIETVRSSQTQAEGEAGVLESEIRMDKGRTGDTEVTAMKEEKLARLQQKAAELTSKTAEMSGEVTEEIRKERAYTKKEPAEEEEGKEEEA